MDTHPRRPDDLSELERRLTACEPAGAGLDADAMLFAAGRASVRPGPARFVWPALTACLAALVAVLAVCLAHERSERLHLIAWPQEPAPVPAPAPSPSLAPDEPSPDSLIVARRALEQGLDAWRPRLVAPPDPLTPENVPVLHWGRPASLPDL